MADVSIDIAGRRYRVACADGQEAVLAEAGALIAAEAESLRAASGERFSALSEVRVLLMAGLMLADRHLETVKGGATEAPEAARLAELEAALAAARAGEAAAVAALDEAAAQVAALAGELRDDEAA